MGSLESNSLMSVEFVACVPPDGSAGLRGRGPAVTCRSHTGLRRASHTSVPDAAAGELSQVLVLHGVAVGYKNSGLINWT